MVTRACKRRQESGVQAARYGMEREAIRLMITPKSIARGRQARLANEIVVPKSL
jgi:hypothetical protein